MAFAMGPQLLDGCVLAVLSQGDAYGYALTQQVKERLDSEISSRSFTCWVKERLDISESTLYPVLRRLQKEQLLTVYDRPYQGRNRRYYAITPPGQGYLKELRREWTRFRDGVDCILKEDGHGQNHLFG